jgi:hypothetical protein
MCRFVNYDTASKRVVGPFGHKLKRQNRFGVIKGALATGCKTTGLDGKKSIFIFKFCCDLRSIRYLSEGARVFDWP